MNIAADLAIVEKYLPILLAVASGNPESIPTPEEAFTISCGSLGTFKFTVPAATITVQKV